MSRYRLLLTPDQEVGLLEHCRHARFVWNLAVEQHDHWKSGRVSAPGNAEQCRQLTEARAEFAWLRAGSVTVQQQALRDFAQAMRNFFGGTHRRPTWRKAGRDEWFRQVAVRSGHVQRLNRKVGRVWVPKVGWVRFRWSRPVPDGVKSYRVTRDTSGRWHVAFAAIPDPIPAPGNGQTVGVDRGVAVSAALSTGEVLDCPGLRPKEAQRLVRLQRRLARAVRGSHRRQRVKAAIATLKACAAGRVEKINAAYTSQTCSACGHVAPDNRESQAVFRCTACGYRANADVNAACNIAAGRAVTARGALQPLGGALNREPQHVTSAASALVVGWNPHLEAREDVNQPPRRRTSRPAPCPRSR